MTSFVKKEQLWAKRTTIKLSLCPHKRPPHLPQRLKNRLVLIEATLRALSELGFANAIVSEIIKRARLSRGMIHHNFCSKDNSLIEAAKHAIERYHAFLEACLEFAGSSPQEQVESLLNMTGAKAF